MSFGHRREDVKSSLDDLYNDDVNYSLPFLAVQEGAKAWHTFKGYHAMPAYLNSLNNAILRGHLSTSEVNSSSLYGIFLYCQSVSSSVCVCV